MRVKEAALIYSFGYRSGGGGDVDLIYSVMHTFTHIIMEDTDNVLTHLLV